MKTTFTVWALGCLLMSASAVVAQGPRIVSIDSNGTLTWTNEQVEGAVTIEWAPNLTGGPWSDSWNQLSRITVTGEVMSVSIPLFYRVVPDTPSPGGPALAEVPYDPVDKATYLSNSVAYPNGFGSYQKGGPEYTFYLSKYEITNQDFVEFLNDAEANPDTARGTNMSFKTGSNAGSVYMSDAWSAAIALFDISVGDIFYNEASEVGKRYVVSAFIPKGGGSFHTHPVVGVSWYGALKYCNWLTITTGRGEAERCYREGPLPGDWQPVTASSWHLGLFSIREREDLLAYQGYRLPMSKAGSLNSFNEFYKAAAWHPLTRVQSTYGFGRSTIDGQDSNYLNSGDFYDNESTPVGWYDGSVHEYFGEIFTTRANENGYGIFDLSGNASEWSNDFFADAISTSRNVTGGSHSESSSSHVASYREARTVSSTIPFLGFRVATTSN